MTQFGRVEQLDVAINRHYLRTEPPAWFEAEGLDSSFVLITRESRGARVLTIPGRAARDFTAYGQGGIASNVIVPRIIRAICEADVNSVKLPLLEHTIGADIAHLLKVGLPCWRFELALTDVAPIASRDSPRFKKHRSLSRALRGASRRGFTIEVAHEVPLAEFTELHKKLWGLNRPVQWFEMLAVITRLPFVEVLAARNNEGRLVGCQVDIVAGDTRHYYCSVADWESQPGIGTALLAQSWRRFLDEEGTCSYSFGRGGERYKYRYATGYRELYELRGFYCPVELVK